MDTAQADELRPINLAIRTLDGRQEKPLGKVVPYRGRWILHEWVQAKWQRHDARAWGVNAALLDWLEARGVEDVYLYAAKEHITHHATIATIVSLGREQVCAPFGTNINLPVNEWVQVPGRLTVPWVPEDCKRIIPRRREEPTTTGVPVVRENADIRQLGLPL